MHEPAYEIRMREGRSWKGSIYIYSIELWNPGGFGKRISPAGRERAWRESIS